jgi:hypothetical protein
MTRAELQPAQAGTDATRLPIIDADGLLVHLGPAWSLDAPLETIPGMLD